MRFFFLSSFLGEVGGVESEIGKHQLHKNISFLPFLRGFDLIRHFHARLALIAGHGTSQHNVACRSLYDRWSKQLMNIIILC